MEKSEATPSLTTITRPNCPDCGARMMLARIEPEGPGQDRRTFACEKCGVDHSEVVEFK